MTVAILLIIAVAATVVAYSAVVVGSQRSAKEQAYEDKMQSQYLANIAQRKKKKIM